MSKISGNMNKTAVKILVGVLLGYFPSLSCAGSITPEQEKSCESRTAKITDPTAKLNAMNTCISSYTGSDLRIPEDPKALACKEKAKDYKDAVAKIGEACRDAGLSSKTCATNANECAETAEEESFDTMGAFATALGLPAGSTQSQVSSKCPQYNSRDYATQKKETERDIKDTEKELAELNDEKAKLQDDYNKQMQDIQETLTKAQEDYKKKEEDLNQEERERVAQFQESQNQANEAMRKKGDEIIALRGQLTQLLRNKARAIGKLSESTGKLACMAEVNKMKAEYEKLYSSNSSASANFIGQAKKKKQEMINTYNTCMADFHQQRIQLNETTRNQQETLEKKLADTQSSLDEVQNSLNLASTQFEEIKQATAKKKQNALQSVIDLGTRSQQQMQAAYTKLQENLKTIATKQASAQAALNRANVSLTSMGPAPKGSAKSTVSEASSIIAAQIEVVRDYQLSGCAGSNQKNVDATYKKYGGSQ